ncbi:MAG: hypothetical protein ACR2OZ_11995 [Verrucomicrobiales bacterium]
MNYFELRLAFTGGADAGTTDAIMALVNSFDDDRDHELASINVGQLKHVGRKFYQRLHEIHFYGSIATPNPPLFLPWNQSSTTEDYAPANIGQLKRLFKFDLDANNWLANASSLTVDWDGDGLSNRWELTYAFNPFSNTESALDIEPDGLTNAQEQALGTDPRKIDTDVDGLKDNHEVPLGTNPIYPDHPAVGLIVLKVSS